MLGIVKMQNLKEHVKEMIIAKLNESKYDTDFRKIEFLRNYDIENVSSSGNKLFLELEDSDFHQVSIEYIFKNTPRGIVIEGKWSRETSSNNSKDDFGKTQKVIVKTLDDAINLFSKSLNNRDSKKVVSKMKSIKI